MNDMAGLHGIKRGSLPFFAMVAFIILSALAIKTVYLHSAESRYNAEELPLAPMTLVSGTPANVDVAATRLYGTYNITTALSLKAFGFTTLGVKAPNILFFFLTLLLLYFFSRRYLATKHRWHSLLPVALLCFGPPVIQIWGMKNRGGFIENIFALALCLWICASAKDGKLTSIQKLALAIIIGLATWSQPIGIVWGSVILGYVLLQDLQSSIREATKSAFTIAGGLLLGLLPLIALNFLFQFNTVNVIERGEMPGGIDLGYLGRLQQLLVDGVPRLLGLKEQWKAAWIVPAPLAWALYAVFVLPALGVSLKVCQDALKTRRASLGLVLVGVAVAILAANVVSTWGNFQSEPRRLLMLYVPFALLTAYGLSRIPRPAMVYLAIWLGFNAWANYQYVNKNRQGFANELYKPLDQVVAFLRSEDIRGVYTDVWTGGPMTFASRGMIPWYRSPYIESSYGYVGNDDFDFSEAMLFNLHSPRGVAERQRFIGDIGRAGILCSEQTVEDITIVYNCSQEFKFSELPGMKPRDVAGQVVISRVAADSDVGVIAGSKATGLVVANGQAGFLICGPYVPMPAGDYTVVIEGSSTGPLQVDVASAKGTVVIAKKDFARAEQPAKGVLASMDFKLERPVRDLEVRIVVPAGSDTAVERYRIVGK